MHIFSVVAGFWSSAPYKAVGSPLIKAPNYAFDRDPVGQQAVMLNAN